MPDTSVSFETFASELPSPSICKDVFFPNLTYGLLIRSALSILQSSSIEIKEGSLKTYVSTLTRFLAGMNVDWNAPVRLGMFNSQLLYEKNVIDRHTHSVISTFRDVLLRHYVKEHLCGSPGEWLRQVFDLFGITSENYASFVRVTPKQYALLFDSATKNINSVRMRIIAELQISSEADQYFQYTRNRLPHVSAAQWTEVEQGLARLLSASLRQRTREALPAKFKELPPSIQQQILYSTANSVAIPSRPRLSVSHIHAHQGQFTEEMASLVKFKTAPHTGGRRRTGRWCPESAKLNKTMLSGYLSYLNADSNAPLPGLGIPFEQITLAYILNPHTVTQYVDALANYQGGYSGRTRSILTDICSLLRPHTGWLWQESARLSTLPEDLVHLVASAGGWHAACAQSLEHLKETLRSLRQSIEHSTGAVAKLKPILQAQRPLDLVMVAIQTSLRTLPRHDTPTVRDAKLWRRHVLCHLLAIFPIRSKNLWNLTCDLYIPDHSHLRRDAAGRWYLRLHTKELKNGRVSKRFRGVEFIEFKLSEYPAFHSFLEVFETYIMVYRPLLTSTSSVFADPQAGQEVRNQIALMVKKWTGQFLSTHSKYQSRVPGVQPFGPHGFRHIVATHAVRVNHSYVLAASLLLDSEEMVRRHYVHVEAQDILDRDFALWSQEHETSTARAAIKDAVSR